MSNTLVKFFLPLLILSVAIPESEAKRMGSGRSSGRQVQGVRKSTPPAARTVRPQQAQPPSAATPRQSSPDDRIARPQPLPQAPPAPASPTQALPRQAASPWGGMLGGALLGLGIGSVMSRDGNAANQPNQQQPGSGSDSSSGSSSSGETGSGASGDYADSPAAQLTPQNTPQAAGGSTLRTFLPVGLLALIIYFTVRRMRRRNR